MPSSTISRPSRNPASLGVCVSAEAQQEERNAPKNLDHTAVARNAKKYLTS